MGSNFGMVRPARQTPVVGNAINEDAFKASARDKSQMASNNLFFKKLGKPYEVRKAMNQFKGKSAEEAAQRVIDMLSRNGMLERIQRVLLLDEYFDANKAYRAASVLYGGFDGVLLARIKNQTDRMMDQGRVGDAANFLKDTVMVHHLYDSTGSKEAVATLKSMYFRANEGYVKILMGQRQFQEAAVQIELGIIYARINRDPGAESRLNGFVADLLRNYQPRGPFWEDAESFWNRSRTRSQVRIRIDFDPYKVLGVERSATEAEIKAAFRRLVRQYHPDVNSNPDAESRVRNVLLAYDILGDATNRENYDLYGMTTGARRR